MAKSIEDQVLDRKTKEQIRHELLEVINTKMKDEIASQVAIDVRESFDDEYKDSIKSEIHNELVVEIKDDIRKEQAKLSRRKSFKIFRLYIYIIVLLALIGYLVYLLYNNGGLDLFDKYKIIKKDDDVTTTIPTTLVKKDFQYYYDNYSYLVDRVEVSNYELLKGNYDVMSIATNDRLALAYNNLSSDKVKVEGIIYSVLADDLLNSYKELFGTTEGYKTENFIVHNISYAYQESTATYIAVPLESSTYDKVVNDIVDIIEDNNSLVFKCKVAILKNDNDLYNVLNMEEIVGSYKENGDLSSYNEKLSSIKYIFKNVNGKYYLSNIVFEN